MPLESTVLPPILVLLTLVEAETSPGDGSPALANDFILNDVSNAQPSPLLRSPPPQLGSRNIEVRWVRPNDGKVSGDWRCDFDRADVSGGRMKYFSLLRQLGGQATGVEFSFQNDGELTLTAKVPELACQTLSFNLSFQESLGGQTRSWWPWDVVIR